MMKPILATTVALATVIGAQALTIDTASAANGRHGAFAAGAAAGVVGGAILGGALNRPYYDDSYTVAPAYGVSRCHIERRYVTDEYGDQTVQRVRVCVRPGY